MPGGGANKSIYDIAADSQNNLYMTSSRTTDTCGSLRPALVTFISPTVYATGGNMNEQDASGSRNIAAKDRMKPSRRSLEWPLPTVHAAL